MKIFNWVVAALLLVSPAYADVTVSNGPASDNPDYTVKTEQISGVEYPGTKLIDSTPGSTAPTGIASHPLWCSITGNAPMNITQYGGTNTTLGTKAASASIPVTLANNENYLLGSLVNQTGRGMQIAIHDPFDGDFAWTGTAGVPSVNANVTNYSSNPLFTTDAILYSTFDTITSNGDSVTQTNSHSHVTVSVYGTYSNINLAFEGTVDGTNWVAATAFRSDTGQFETTSGALSSTQRIWKFGSGWSQLRARATSYSSGTMNVSWIVYGRAALPVIGTWAAQSGTWSVGINAALPAGTNNIGDVDVLTLPALPAGTNNIGDVDVLTLPSLPAGTNNIGDVDVLTLPSLPAGTNNIGDVDIVSSVLPTGAATSAYQSSHSAYLGAIDAQIAGLHEEDTINGKGEVWKTGMWDATNGAWRSLESDDQGYVKVVMKPEADTVILNRAITWGTVTRTTVSTAATAASSNSSRRALSLWNESGGQIKWTFNGTASSTNYQGILSAGQGLIFEGSTNSTQALSIIAVSGTVTYTISEGT